MLKMKDCLIRGDSSDLVSVLHCEGLTSVTLTRLDQLVTKDLCGSGFSRVLVVLKSLRTLTENRDQLQTLIDHGLTAKVLLWFEAVHDLLISDLQKNSAALLSLAEEFYNYFLLLGQACLPVSQLSLVLLQLARFALEPEIHFPLRLEAIRTFNSILESLSREQRRLIQTHPNQTQILSEVAAAVLTVGDYELQVSLSEALCRLTARKDRKQRANRWFSSRDISKAFCNIRDRDFEVDCRHFLNFVNSYHGEQRRVYTFPCLRAFMDSIELFRPNDNKLDEFWIDFNLSSGCVSFFVDEPQGFLWGSVHLLKDDVDRYSLQVKRDGCTGPEVVLSIQLNTPIMHHNSRGQTVELSFDWEHHRELEEAAGRVFMKAKSSPRLKDAGGTVQVSPSAQQSGRSYSRKKPPSKSQLKMPTKNDPKPHRVPMLTPVHQSVRAGPRSHGMHYGKKTPAGLRSELLFDQITHSSPSHLSGVPVGAELNISQEQTEEFGGKKEVFSPDRKRAAADSGYLSDQTEGLSAHKRRAEPQLEWEEPNSPLKQSPPEGVEPPEEEEGRSAGEAGSCVEREGPVIESGMEAESYLTSGITAAFNAFKTQLEQHFTGCWQNVETEVLLSLKEGQQHVSSLLTAVHQQRLVLLQRFENSVTEQLNQLQENSTSLNSINTQILSFFQSEMEQLASFCDERRQRLKSLDSRESGMEHPSSQ